MSSCVLNPTKMWPPQIKKMPLYGGEMKESSDLGREKASALSGADGSTEEVLRGLRRQTCSL